MEVSGRYGFNAPPEVVFNTLTDPDRRYRWLPLGVVAEPGGLRLSLRSQEAPGFQGTAVVEQDPAGGSQLRVSVTADDAERARELLDAAMGQLSSDVDENFNTG